MKALLLLFSFIIMLAGCVQSQDCPQNINQLPMYGGVKKCKEQIEADKEFIALIDKQYKSRKDAAKHLVSRGWEYLYAQDLESSMKRFNQAWLIDSLNADVFWGFGNLLGLQRKYTASIKYFEISLKLNSKNARVWQDASVSYGNAFGESKDKKYLNTAIDHLKAAASLDPKNPTIYASLTSAYMYFPKKDSALKYLKITENIDPNAIQPDVRKILTNR